jgi:hypothetical protein
MLTRITLLAVLVGSLMLAFGTGTASAAKPCWQRVIDDWYDGRIDGIYSVACMRTAIKNAPEDITQYSDLKSDLMRALAERPKEKMGGQLYVTDPGTKGAGQDTQDPQGDGRGDDSNRVAVPVKPPDSGDGGGGAGSGPLPRAIGAGSDDPSSLPIPVIALGALALLLLASGATGLVARRVRAHRATTAPPSADA